MFKGKSEGVHAFLARIRDSQGQLVKGVWLEDLGYKFGLNGVDNARISFNQFKVSKDALLDKYSQITADG
jgi:acyl-CoA oxidase